MKILYLEDERPVAESVEPFLRDDLGYEVIYPGPNLALNDYARTVEVLFQSNGFDVVIQDFQLETTLLTDEQLLYIPLMMTEFKNQRPNLLWIVLSASPRAPELLENLPCLLLPKGPSETLDRLEKLLADHAAN